MLAIRTGVTSGSATVPSLYGGLRKGFALAALVVALVEEFDTAVFEAGVFFVLVELLPEAALVCAADFVFFVEVFFPPVAAFVFFADVALAATFGVNFGVAAADMSQGSARASASRAAADHRAGDRLSINTVGITRERAIVKHRWRAGWCIAGLLANVGNDCARMALRFGSLPFRTLHMRPMSAVEIALVVSVAGCVLAASAPTFFREIHASRMSEAVDGLNRIGAGALAYSQGKELAASFPPAAPLTPSEVPRGTSIKDPESTWDTPTWRALDFGFDRAHHYAFKFDVANDPNRIWFQATAHGDLNGDGILSTFQLTGERQVGQDASLLPGIFVHREVE